MVDEKDINITIKAYNFKKPSFIYPVDQDHIFLRNVSILFVIAR